MKHRNIKVNDLTLHTVECGDPQAPLVLFIHGFPEFWHCWQHQLSALGQAGYYAVAVDMPGYGQSSIPAEVSRYNQISLSDDITLLASKLGHEHFIPVGHDYGAPTAWHCALRYPERVTAVVGMSIPYGGRPPVSPNIGFKRLFSDQFFYINYFQQTGIAEAELEGSLEAFLRSFFYYSSGESQGRFDTSGVPANSDYLTALPDPGCLPKWLNAGLFKQYVNNFKANGLSGPLSYYRNFDESWKRTEALSDTKITCPALFVSGEHDPVTKFGAEYERMDHWVPSVRKIEIEGVGHWVQQEATDRVNSELLSFLEGLELKTP